MRNIFRETIILFSFFSILHVSCEPASHCKVDKFVKKEFSKKFKNIKNANLENGIGGQLFVDIIFMHEITGIESSVNFGEISYYENKQDLKKDLNAWKSWFEKNKCAISKDSVALLEKQIIDSNPWIGFSE